MRICVLSVLKELIIHVLNNDELDELQRKTRDDYINIMQDHLFDVNAFVRSKVSTQNISYFICSLFNLKIFRCYSCLPP